MVHRTGYAAIGRIATTGTVTEFTQGITANSSPRYIAAGPDGNLWFTDYFGGIGKVTTNGTVTEFLTGLTSASYPEGIVTGPDGNLWFTEDSARTIGRMQ